jgi:CDP-glucose 4,6-dehydratase
MSFWKSRPVLVTGATGLLGGWLVKHLIDRGAEVVALVRDNVPGSLLAREGILDHIQVVHGSLSDDSLIRRALAEYEIKTVMHLAAQTLVGVAKQDPVGTLEANIRGSWNVLEAARQSKGVQVLVASSDKAYGDSPNLPYTEDQPLRGVFPYDCSKSCVDLISKMYAHTYGLQVGIVRCGNLFGGGDLNFSRLIPGILRASLRREPFLIRSDGQNVRDYLYVEDAADAYLVLAEKLASDPSLSGEAFNFSLEVRYTVLELLALVQAQLGSERVEPIIQNIASNEIREQYTSAAKALRLLDWKPRFGMEEGIRRSIDWYRTHLGLDSDQPKPQAASSGS